MKESREALAIDASVCLLRERLNQVKLLQIPSIRWAEFSCILSHYHTGSFLQISSWLLSIYYICCLVSLFVGQKSSSLRDNPKRKG